MSFKMKLILVLKFLILLLSCNNDKPKLKYNKDLDKSKEYYVVLMAGQSNMVGLGEVKDLDNCYLPNNVSYFNYSTNSHLKEFSNYYFGPEVGLAKRLNKEFPNLNFIFVKFAIGSSSINEWLPNVESKIYRKVDFGDLYDKFYKMTDSVTKNFNTKTLALLWMQGETDARYKSTSDDYENNFKLFISKVRKDYNNHNLPIVFGKVNPYSENHKYVSQIQLAQKNIINSLPNTYMIETETLDKQKDNVHYSSSGLLKLGEAYGDVLCLILKNEIEKL